MTATKIDAGSDSRSVRLLDESSDFGTLAPGAWRVIALDTSSPAASGTGEYEIASADSLGVEGLGSAVRQTSSASRQLLQEPLWRTYLRERLVELMSRVGRPSYPALETLNGAWSVAHGVLKPRTVTPSVLPGEDRSVELVWNRGDWHIELEISGGSPYVWAKNLRTGEVVSGDLDETREVLQDLLADVSSA